MQKIQIIEPYTQIAIKGTSSFKSTLFKILKGSIGSGVLSIPFAFSICGVIGGIILLILVGIFNYISWISMIKAMTKQDSPDDQQVVIDLPKYIEKHYGNGILFRICLSSTILVLFGSAVSYLILCLSVIKNTFPIFEDIQNQVLLWTIFMFIINFAARNKSLENFNFITFTATLLTFLVISFVVAYCANIIQQKKDSVHISLFIIERLPIALGVVLFSYDINGIITEVRAEMKDPLSFKRVLAIGMILVGISYMIIGSVGYKTFGGQTSQIITDDILSIIQDKTIKYFFIFLVYAYAISLFATILLFNIPGLNCVKNLLKSYEIFDERSKCNTQVVNFIFILFETMIPFVYPKFSQVLSLLGCVCSVTLGFVIPFILYKDAFWSQIKSNEKIMRIFVLTFGVAGGILGVILNFLL